MKKRKVEKEKKYNYKIIIGLILGLVIGSIGVYAATQIASSNVTYTNNNQENVQGAIDDLYSKTLYLGKIKIGDYVSMTPTSEEYTILKEDTGYTEDQTINPSELNVWRIISINSDGTADAVSEYASTKNINFYEKAGYKNYVGILNRVASAYENPKYVARTRCIGYGGGTEYLSNTLNTLDSTLTTPPWDTSTSTNTQPLDEQYGGGDLGYLLDYNLVMKVLKTLKTYKVETTTSVRYYMASRFYRFDSVDDYSYVAMMAHETGLVRSTYLYRYNNGKFINNEITGSIRPIITLKPELTISGGDGKSESTAWTFS